MGQWGTSAGIRCSLRSLQRRMENPAEPRDHMLHIPIETPISTRSTGPSPSAADVASALPSHMTITSTSLSPGSCSFVGLPVPADAATQVTPVTDFMCQIQERGWAMGTSLRDVGGQ